jgi:hypothetical protein
MSDDRDLLNSIAASALHQLPSGPSLEIKYLMVQPAPILRRLLRLWVRERSKLDISYERTQSIVELIEYGQGGTCIQLGEGWAVTRAGKQINLDQSTADHPGGISES